MGSIPLHVPTEVHVPDEGERHEEERGGGPCEGGMDAEYLFGSSRWRE